MCIYLAAPPCTHARARERQMHATTTTKLQGFHRRIEAYPQRRYQYYHRDDTIIKGTKIARFAFRNGCTYAPTTTNHVPGASRAAVCNKSDVQRAFGASVNPPVACSSTISFVNESLFCILYSR